MWAAQCFTQGSKSHLHSADMSFLDKVQKATKSSQDDCVKKGWKLYRNTKGEEVKLRHVLEKIHVWVGEIIKVVDIGVSADQSGHAALPWAIVKLIIEVGQYTLNSSKVAKAGESRLDFQVSMCSPRSRKVLNPFLRSL